MKPLMSFNKDHNNHHLAEKGTGREDTHWMGQEELEEVLLYERTRVSQGIVCRKWKRPQAISVSMEELNIEEKLKPKLA